MSSLQKHALYHIISIIFLSFFDRLEHYILILITSIMAFNYQATSSFTSLRSKLSHLTSYKSLNLFQSHSKVESDYQSNYLQSSKVTISRQINFIVHSEIMEGQVKRKRLNKLFQLVSLNFEQRFKYEYFTDFKQILKMKFKEDQVYFMVVHEDLRQKCTQLVENQRKIAINNADLCTLCLFQNQNEFKKFKRLYNSKIHTKQSCFYFYLLAPQIHKEIVEIVKKYSKKSAGNNASIIRRCASSKKLERRRSKLVNFYCESIIYNMLLNYKLKSKNSNINVVKFAKFEDILLILKKDKLSSIKETSRYTKTQGSFLQQTSSKMAFSNILTNSYFPKAQVSKMQESTVDQMNLCIQEASSNIIICRKYNIDIKKIRSFVNSESKNWHLWEISDSAPDIFANLRVFFGEYNEKSVINDYQLYQEQYCKRVIPQKVKDQNACKNQMLLQTKTSQSILSFTKDLESFNSIQTLQSEEQLPVKNNHFILVSQPIIVKVQQKDIVVADPIQLKIQKQYCILQKIKRFASKPLNSLDKMKIPINFKEKVLPQRQVAMIQFQPALVQSQVPSLSKYDQFLPEKSSINTLGINQLNRIKQKVLNYDQLQFNLDKQKPYFRHFKIENDQFCSFLPLQLSHKPKVIYKLAVLYPNNENFNALAQVFKENLEPAKCFLTLISFSTNFQLQNLYESKDQKMFKHDKIVLFLQKPQDALQTQLKQIKQKLSNRFQYFILTDSFSSIYRQKLVNHLPNYQIKNLNTPFQTKTLPKHFYAVKQYIILVSSQIIDRYKVLQNGFTKVFQYKNFDSYKWLKKANSFVIMVLNEQQYHYAKKALKFSQTCAIIVQSSTQLKQDEFFLYKIQQFCLYYGKTGLEYLQKFLPQNPPENKYISKYLYFKSSQYEYTLDSKYEQYDKIEYSTLEEIYRYVVIFFRGLNNYLLRVFNKAHTIVTLQPVVYMERPLYLKQFKYFSQQSHDQSLTFWDLPQIYYQNELSLTSKLKAQQTPGIVLYSKNNEKWMSNLKIKHKDKFKWFCLEDQSWIDQEGNINSDTDLIKLSTKIKIFSQMFDYLTFNACKELTYMFITYTNKFEEIYMKTIKSTEKDLIVKKQQEVIQLYQHVKDKVFIVFIQEAESKPKHLLQKSQEDGSRIKLIFVNNKFMQDSSKLYIKYTEINPVVKHIQKLNKLGKRSFIIYHTLWGKIKAESFITQKGLANIEQRTYRNLRPQLQGIASEIKGHYKKIFVICFQDEMKDIQKLLNSYNIVNASQQHSLQFVLMKRISLVKNFKKQKKLQLNFSQIKEEQYSCFYDCPEEYELALESGPHSSIKHQNEKKKEDEESYRGNLPIQSSEHLDRRKIKMLNIEDYSKIFIVYQQNLELQNKKQLLVACTKNQNLRPVLYNSISELKLMKEQKNSLMLFFMKEIPMQLFTELVQKQKQQIVFNQTNLKAVLPKKTDINLNSITCHFQLVNNSTVKRLKVQQVNQYLRNYELESKKVKPNTTVIEQQYGLHPIFDNQKQIPISAVSPTQEEFTKLKKSLNGSLLVLMVDFQKRNNYTTLALRYKCLIQSYSDQNSLQNEIKTRIQHIIICLVSKHWHHKLEYFKQKYSNIFFLLQINRSQENIQIKDKIYLAGQFSKQEELQKMLSELTKDNQKLTQINLLNALEYKSDMSGKEKKQERNNFNYQSMMSRAELKKFKQASASIKNAVVSQEMTKRPTLRSSKSKLKATQKTLKSLKSNEYYQT